MRARLTFCTILAVGALLTTGVGVGFAQTGLDGSDSAGQQQYDKTRPKADVLGEVGTVEEDQAAPQPQQQTLPEAQAAPAPAAAPSEGQLPFTGFAALTTLLLGLALVGAGMVLRRNTRSRGSES